MSTPYNQTPQGRGGPAQDNRPPGATAVPAIAITNLTQVEQYQTGPDGRPALGYLISFTTPSGTRASVFVPATDYNEANARAAIMSKANEVERVHQIASQ